jgi:hypothetical protein
MWALPAPLFVYLCTIVDPEQIIHLPFVHVRSKADKYLFVGQIQDKYLSAGSSSGGWLGSTIGSHLHPAPLGVEDEEGDRVHNTTTQTIYTTLTPPHTTHTHTHTHTTQHTQHTQLQQLQHNTTHTTHTPQHTQQTQHNTNNNYNKPNTTHTTTTTNLTQQLQQT